ncbi:hypothetical protein HPB49_024111 [Dermacentor silvarum]|uniref:Uncharacterized protein n=1 Tax=Dermacentor silvarum TaxID=543639 RepID=A0ACB8CI69_DERSI|nr:hypothetical protein HPB49_024111 [Dermacentor silvarum]
MTVRLHREEVSRIVEEFGKTGGKPVDANQYLIPCVFNNIASFFYGSQVPHDHPSRRELNQVLLRVSAAVKGGLKFNFYPSFLRKLLAKLPFTPNGRLNKAVKELDAVSECVEDVVIDDYFIPKGTVVYPNIWAVNHDPRHWKDPAKFDPGRYLNEDGSIIAPKPEHLVTFSVGRRACPGEMFATVEIFLAITHLLQKYRILLEKPLEYDLDSLETQLLRINAIKLRFLPRQAGDSSKTN